MQALFAAADIETGTPAHLMAIGGTYVKDKITKVTKTYTGAKDRGVVAQGEKSNSNWELYYSQSRAVSHEFNATFGLPKELVTAQFGIKFNKTFTELAGARLPIPKGKRGQIMLSDIYKVSLFNCERTTTKITNNGPVITKKSGTGFVNQWVRFAYRTRIY